LSLISNISKVNKIMVWLETPNNHHQPLHIPKLYDNTPFHNSNDTHAGTINHQVTITFMENQQGNTLINTEKMKVDEHALVLIKNRLHH